MKRITPDALTGACVACPLIPVIAGIYFAHRRVRKKPQYVVPSAHNERTSLVDNVVWVLLLRAMLLWALGKKKPA